MKLFCGLLFLVSGRDEQRTDGQGDTLAIGVDVDDLCIHFLTLGQHIG